jgi:hypothetical protein
MANSFSRLGEFSVIIFVEYIMFPFSSYLFSFFNTPDSQVWSFDGVADFLQIHFTALELFD